MFRNFVRQTLFVWVAGVLLCVGTAHSQTGNIDATDKYAWGTNTGWINFRPANGGVTVHDTYLSGYAWNENIGWIGLGDGTGGPYNNDAAGDWGVNRDGAGNLSGYAWNANVGWINFNPSHSEVTVDTETGSFDGYAYSENVGWIHFRNADPAYNVRYDIPLPPEITGQQALSTQERTPLIITLNDLIVTDLNNIYPDDFTLTVQDGESYSRSGSTVTPVSGFTGELTVPVIVNDGGDDSNLFNLTVTVTESPNIAPVVTGQAATLSATQGTAQVITPDDLEVTDPDSNPDDFTLTIQPGDNYTFSENTVIPGSDFTGELKVGIIVSDGTDTSEVFEITVTVTARSADAPEITEHADDISVISGSPLPLILASLSVTTNSDKVWPDDFVLTVYGGENYALSGNTLTPDADFIGELSVPVSVGDGENDSNVFSLAIIVAARADGVKQITGTVTTDTGEPAAGVTVVARNPDIGGDDITVVTDADGKYTLQVSGGNWEVQVMQDDAANWFSPNPETVTFANDNSGERMEQNITLEAAVRLTGTVTADGAAVGGENVTVRVRNPDTGLTRDFHPDENGDYAFPMPPGSYEITIIPDESKYPGYTAAPPSVISTGNGDISIPEISLPARNSVLHGSVKDSQGNSVPGISLDVWNPEGGTRFTAVTDAEGNYEIALPAGEYLVMPSPGGGSGILYSDAPQRVTLEPDASETADEIRTESAPHTIVGTVRSRDGKMLEDVDAWAYTRMEDSPRAVARTRVSRGEFTLNVPAGTQYVGLELAPGSGYSFAEEKETSLGRRKPGISASATAEAAIAEMSEHEQTVRVNGRRSVTNVTVILEANDASVKGVFQDATGNPFSDVPGNVFVAPEGNKSAWQQCEIKDGKFELKVAEGMWNLSYSLDTDRYLRSPALPIHIRAVSGNAVIESISLVPMGRMVSGQITNADGNPAVGALARVRLIAAGGVFEALAVTGSDGKFEVFMPSAGTERTARGWGQQASVTTAVSQCQAEEDEHEPPFMLTGTILTDLGGEGVPQTVITKLETLGDMEYSSEYSFTYALRGAIRSYHSYHQHKSLILERAATSHTFGMVQSCLREAAASTIRPASRPSGWRDAREDDSSLKLRNADTFIAGTIFDGDGKPVRSAFVSGYSADGQKAYGRTDGNGDFRLFVARAGENGSNAWTLRAVYESEDAWYRTDGILCDLSGTEKTVLVENLILKSVTDIPLPRPEIEEFPAEHGLTLTLSDGTQIQIPGNAVPTSEDTVRIFVTPRAEGLPHTADNRVISYGYEISLYEKESGMRISDRLDKDILITLRYTDEMLEEWGMTARDIRPSSFSKTSGSWLPAREVTLDKEARKIVFQTDHLSLWALTGMVTEGLAEPGDTDGDGSIGLDDAILALQVCADFPLPRDVYLITDINDDGRIGLAEATHVLRNIAGNDEDGTVTDSLTGLAWLKNANCSDTVGGVTGGSRNTWADALTFCNNLASGSCGLTDGSSAGDWRLPTRLELFSLLDLSQSNPALPSGHPFSNVQNSYYWTSTAYLDNLSYTWYVHLGSGSTGYGTKAFAKFYVWPVRAGQ